MHESITNRTTGELHNCENAPVESELNWNQNKPIYIQEDISLHFFFFSQNQYILIFIEYVTRKGRELQETESLRLKIPVSAHVVDRRAAL